MHAGLQEGKNLDVEDGLQELTPKAPRPKSSRDVSEG
jgi:hypothetical protein